MTPEPELVELSQAEIAFTLEIILRSDSAAIPMLKGKGAPRLQHQGRSGAGIRGSFGSEVAAARPMLPAQGARKPLNRMREPLLNPQTGTCDDEPDLLQGNVQFV